MRIEARPIEAIETTGRVTQDEWVVIIGAVAAFATVIVQAISDD